MDLEVVRRKKIEFSSCLTYKKFSHQGVPDEKKHAKKFNKNINSLIRL